MGRLVYHVNAGLLGLGFLVAGCTAVLGINKDYRENSGGTGGASAGGGGPGAGGGVASQSSAASTSSGSSAEDCFDNKDNNGDTKIDCEDALCSGVAQCDAVPAGWTVVWAMLVGDASMPPGMCADGMTPQTAYYTQPGSPATCSQCVCNAAGATCTAPEISCWYNSNNCNGGANTVQQANNTQCINLAGVPGGANSAGSCKITAPGKFAGSCNANGGAPSLGPKWGGAVFVCDALSSSGGCANGQSCVPAKPSPAGDVCIKKLGTDACPAGWSKAISAFMDGDDNRACTPCQCAGACTGGSYIVRDASACTDSDPPAMVTANNVCVAAPNIFDQNIAGMNPTLAMPGVASCAGGQPQGQVNGIGPVQICCK